MLGFKPYIDPWRRHEPLPPVDLDAIMLQVEYSGRPLHQQAAMRQALGLPTTNSALERGLKDLGLWPAEAKPLPFDIADLLYMLPRFERRIAYGLLAGLKSKEIAKGTGFSVGTVDMHRRVIGDWWTVLAGAFGLLEDQDPDTLLKPTDLACPLGYPTSNRIRNWEVCDWFGLPYTQKGIARKDFPAIYARLTRWEDLPKRYVHSLRSCVSQDTAERYFSDVTRPFEEPITPDPAECWLTESQAEARLGLGPMKFGMMVDRGKLPAHLVPGLKGARFKPEEVDAVRKLVDCTPWEQALSA